MFQEGWIELNEVPTHVTTWGGWIEDEITSDSLVLCITGNPGLPDFYHVFLSTLHSLTNFPVWAVNFAGCEIPPCEVGLSLPSLNKNGHLYNLNGQVDHKEEFIRKYVPPSKGIYLVGHSVGGKIVVELLKRGTVGEKNLKRAFLLFPTLQEISQTRNGRFVMSYMRHFIPLAVWLSYFFSKLPYRVKEFLLKMYFGFRTSVQVDKSCFQGALKLLNHKSVRGIFFLAMDEMNNIKQLDQEVLEKYSEQIHCFYSKTDGWAPVEHAEELKRICPRIKATVVEDHIVHAFVLSTPREVAAKLASEMNQ